MKVDTFKIFVEPDGTEYVYQAIDEMDKNHGIQDTENTNNGRMYSTNSKYLSQKVCVQTKNSIKNNNKTGSRDLHSSGMCKPAFSNSLKMYDWKNVFN